MIGTKLLKNMEKYLLIFSILILAFVVRFYNFSNRVTFGPEQARSLVVSSEYINDKPSLLGQEYFRTNSLGQKLFTSAIFNYSLVPLIFIFKYQPLPITLYFAFLNIITAIVFYFVVKKIFNIKLAAISFTLFVFSYLMIYHSMFIWVLNYLPLVGILTFYLLYKVVKGKSSWKDIFLLGVLSGIGFGLEYLYVLTILIVLYVLFKYSKEKLKTLSVFLIGAVVGDLPQVLFDLKHNFYHLKTLWQYTLDTFRGVSDAGFTYYHFLHFWPLVILAISYLVYIVIQKNKHLGILLIVIYIIVNLNSSLINFNKPVGMSEGLNLTKLIKTSKIIAEKSSNNFNIVTLYDFDTRGYTLRYLTKYIFNKTPMGILDYPSSPEIFSLAENNYNFKGSVPWELTFLKPYNIEVIEKIGDDFSLYKITKK